MSGAAANTFRRNVTILLGGTALAQAIPLLAAPLLTRLYTPEQFGALAILMAVANPISLVVCGRYELTVVLPRDDARANQLARLALLLAVVVSLAIGLLLWLFRAELAALLGGDAALMPLLLAPLLFGMMGFFQPLNNWLIRKQAFRAMGLNKLVQTSGITLVSLAMGWWAIHHGLLWAYLAGWVLYVLVGVMQVRWKDFRFRPLDIAAMRAASRDYRAFPLYNTLPALLHTATLSIPVFLLVRVFGEEATGQFNLCRQTVFLPVTFFATTWMQVYMQQASHTVAQRQPVGPGLRRGLRTLGAMAVVLLLVLVIGGPWLFGFVFGATWAEAGWYARILALPIALQFVVTPLTVLLPALGRIKGLSLWQAGYFTAVLAYSLLPAEVPRAYLTGLAAVESLCLIGLLLYLLRAVHLHDRDLRPDDTTTAA